MGKQKVKLDEKGIIAVTEVIHAPEEIRNYYYFDLCTKKASAHGQKDEAPTRPMTTGAFAWAVKQYLPKALAYAQKHNIAVPLSLQNLALSGQSSR